MHPWHKLFSEKCAFLRFGSPRRWNLPRSACRPSLRNLQPRSHVCLPRNPAVISTSVTRGDRNPQTHLVLASVGAADGGVMNFDRNLLANLQAIGKRGDIHEASAVLASAVWSAIHSWMYIIPVHAWHRHSTGAILWGITRLVAEHGNQGDWPQQCYNDKQDKGVYCIVSILDLSFSGS